LSGGEEHGYQEGSWWRYSGCRMHVEEFAGSLGQCLCCVVVLLVSLKRSAMLSTAACMTVRSAVLDIVYTLGVDLGVGRFSFFIV
jgi:hypothetical protein